MKTILKNKVLIVLIFILSLFVVGCGEKQPGGSQSNYNEANYTLYGQPTLEKNLTLEELKAALDEASNYLATVKSYSYTQTITGTYDTTYNYQGVTKIDATGETPMASIELTGTNTFACYIANNKAYYNYDGYKFVTELGTDSSNIIEETSATVGAFTQFDSSSITSDNLIYAGVDKDQTTIIKYNIEDGAFVIIVISEAKIMKVMYSGVEGEEYIANYDYNKVTVALPSDLSDYETE